MNSYKIKQCHLSIQPVMAAVMIIVTLVVADNDNNNNDDQNGGDRGRASHYTMTTMRTAMTPDMIIRNNYCDQSSA